MKLSDIQAWRLVRATFLAWKQDFAQSMGAALAFYTMFSIAPLILIAIEIAGKFFGVQTARGEILSQLSGLVGKDGEMAVQSLLASATDPSRRKMAAGIGIAVFVIGAMSVFNELQDALNRIWHVHGRKTRTGVLGFIRSRLLSFGMVLSIAFLLLVSLIVSATLSAVGRSWTFSTEWQFTAQILNVTFGFVLITAMIAMIYKVIPQTRVGWRDVWVGAITTSVLFTFGKLAIGVYLGRSAVASGFGAVGSLAVFLLWVYYSAQIFLFGAEFTSIYSRGRDTSAGSRP
ncbi:MAG TPA: YihY/virulence factor BrkB family protein [Opitutaceae bacterium]|jgi:membrane protein